MLDHFDPYFKWLAIPPEEQPPNHYRLLGVPLFTWDADVISHAADQRMAHLRSLQTGHQGAASQRLLTDISIARSCLLDVATKAEYDTELRRQMAAQQGTTARTLKRIPARPVPLGLPPSVTEEEPDWPIADVDEPTTRKFGKKSGTFKPKRRQLNSAYVALPILAVVIGIGLVVYWLQRREIVTSAIGKTQPQPATAPMAPAPVANVPQKPSEDLTPPPRVVEKRPRTDPAIQTPDPSFPDSIVVNPFQETSKEPLPENNPAPPAFDDFPAEDDPVLNRGVSGASTKVQAKVPVPDEASRTKELAEVKSILADDYVKLEKLELARKLLEFAQSSPKGTARTYVLLQEGGKAAVAAGDGALIFELVDELAAQFDNVQATQVKTNALQNAAKVVSKQHAAALAAFILKFTQTLQDEEKFDAAQDLGDSALALGRKSEDNEVLRQAVTRRKEIIALRKDYEGAAEAMAQIKVQPSDPQANGVVGKYYALSKGKWDQGLPMLAAGNDAALKEAATLDLAQPRDADKQVAVGDAWWALSDKATNASKAHLQTRAAHWYQRALPRVTDALSKVKIQKRLEEAGPQEKAGLPGETAAPASVVTPRPVAAKTNSIGMKLVWVPAGEFTMGSPPDEPQRKPEETPHKVKISRPFHMGMYEVTQVEYALVMGKNPSVYIASHDRVRGQDTRRFPVEQVSWQDAMTFCQRLGQKEKKKYRLPTEAEWEYACRAGTKTAFNFGNAASATQANFNGNDPYGGAPAVKNLPSRPTNVGSYAPNRFGLYDMHGNVFEWCLDLYDQNYYGRSPAVDPYNGTQSGGDRVVRGAHFGHPGARCRSASRDQRNSSQGFDSVGFRVVCER